MHPPYTYDCPRAALTAKCGRCYSTPAHTVMGVRHYTAGTIAVITCSPGYHLSKNGNSAEGTGMACKHGCAQFATVYPLRMRPHVRDWIRLEAEDASLVLVLMLDSLSARRIAHTFCLLDAGHGPTRLAR